MSRILAPSLLLLAVLCAVPGCAIDKTRRSVTYTMQAEIDATKERARDIEGDLGLERERIDAIEDRAANASKRLADSGATLETFLDELTALRGEISALQFGLEQSGRFDDDMSLRLAGIEFQIAHISRELKVKPAVMPMGTPLTPAPTATPAPAATPAPVATPAPAPTGAPAGAADRAPADEDPPALDDPPAHEPIVAIDAPPDADADFAEGVALVRDGKWEAAGASLQKYIRKSREGEHFLEAQFLVGQCLFELGRYKNAITEFQKVIEAEDKEVRKGADPVWGPRAMFVQGRAFEELGTKQDLEAAALFFDELVRIYPASPEAERARQRLEHLDANR
jgi:TolA-binding protein